MRGIKPRRKLPPRGALKARIIRILGLLDAKRKGKTCRMIPECPRKELHGGEVAYHVVPAQRGDATRFLPENVIWACRQANYGEVMNRSLYREKHIKRFGRDMVERIETIAREFRHFSRTELAEMLETYKRLLEA